jgi:hypothetical protein
MAQLQENLFLFDPFQIDTSLKLTILLEILWDFGDLAISEKSDI